MGSRRGISKLVSSDILNNKTTFNFIMIKCPCSFPHSSSTASFSINEFPSSLHSVSLLLFSKSVYPICLLHMVYLPMHLSFVTLNNVTYIHVQYKIIPIMYILLQNKNGWVDERHEAGCGDGGS